MTIQYITNRLEKEGYNLNGICGALPQIILDAISYIRNLGYDKWLKETSLGQGLKDLVFELAVPVVTEEEYFTQNGASRSDIGDSALHHNKGNNSDKRWSKMVNEQAIKDRELIEKRRILREEYYYKVNQGIIRPPSRKELLIARAKGMPELESTKAAKRLLEKYNYKTLTT